MIGRVIQFLFASAMIFILSPIWIGLYFIGKYIFGEPFFISERAGKYGIPFTFYKFRSLKMSSNRELSLMDDESNQSKYGNFLRKTHLDETLQLINIIHGNMNLFGPRPLWKGYNSLYSSYQVKRMDVKPGILGLAQVSGGNHLSWKHRFIYDVFYVKHKNSIGLKIIILKRLLFPNKKMEYKNFSEAFNGNN